MAASDAPAVARQPLLGWPLTILPVWSRWVIAGLAIIAIGAGAYIGSEFHPNQQATASSEIEGRIAGVFHDPAIAAWDDAIVGDFLIERFYLLDLNTGDRYIADFLKGRITDIEEVHLQDQPPGYVMLLESKDMRRDKAFYNAYMSTVVDEDKLADAFYLGAITPTGVSDAFPINYTGNVPTQRIPFRQGDETDMYEYMLKQDYKSITGPRGIGLLGHNYVLNTGENFALFRNEFRLERTIFISELVIADATSRPNKTTYYQLLEGFRRPPN
jgi:hypothetical protein